MVEGRAELFQVDVLCRARELHKLFIVQLEGFPEKQRHVLQLNLDTKDYCFGICLCEKRELLYTARTCPAYMHMQNGYEHVLIPIKIQYKYMKV